MVLQVFDEFLQQLGEDTAGYVRTVCQTIVLTVPKAVVHCMVGLLLQMEQHKASTGMNERCRCACSADPRILRLSDQC